MAQKICQVLSGELAPAPPGGCWVGLSQFRGKQKQGVRPPLLSRLAEIYQGFARCVFMP